MMESSRPCKLRLPSPISKNYPIICKSALTNIPRRASTTLSPLAAGTILYNVIDSPVGVVPVTRVDPTEDKLTDDWLNGPGHGSKLLEKALYHDKGAPYNPEKMKGLPVAVQVVGKSFQDEKVLEMMKVVDQALGPRDFGPTVRPNF